MLGTTVGTQDTPVNSNKKKINKNSYLWRSIFCKEKTDDQRCAVLKVVSAWEIIGQGKGIEVQSALGVCVFLSADSINFDKKIFWK